MNTPARCTIFIRWLKCLLTCCQHTWGILRCTCIPEFEKHEIKIMLNELSLHASLTISPSICPTQPPHTLGSLLPPNFLLKLSPTCFSSILILFSKVYVETPLLKTYLRKMTQPQNSSSYYWRSLKSHSMPFISPHCVGIWSVSSLSSMTIDP